MAKLILLRHGQSEWNRKNLFTGWVDVDLTDQGVAEAQKAGEILKDVPFAKCYTSELKRAQRTLAIVLETTGRAGLPVEKDKALNERHYGDLQGKNKAQTAEQFGAEQVHIWRRSYDVAPPGGESLKDTAERTLPYFEAKIAADLKAGVDVLVAAHGNSLRAIIMKLDGLSKDEVTQLNLDTGVPIVYEFDAELNVIDKKILKPEPAS